MPVPNSQVRGSQTAYSVHVQTSSELPESAAVQGLAGQSTVTHIRVHPEGVIAGSPLSGQE